MDVTPLADVLTTAGPATTVWIDVTTRDEAGAHERDLRWRDLRGELERQGAPAADLAVVDEAVGRPTGVSGDASRYLAVRDGDLVLDELLVEPTRDGIGEATTGPLVDVVPLLRYEARHAPVVVVRADRDGADVEVVTAAGGPPQASASTHGATLHLQKVSTGPFSEYQTQRTTENVWRGNAEQAAAEVDRLARESTATAVVLSGDVKARQLIAGALTLRVPVVQVEGDRRAEGASQVPVETALVRGLDERAARTEDEAVQRWRAVHDDPDTRTRSAGDLGEVVVAVRQGQVEELLVVPAALRGRHLLIGPAAADVALPGTEPTWDGPVTEAPADLALLRAAAATGAQVQLVELEAAAVPDGAAARLRWSTDETPGTAGADDA